MIGLINSEGINYHKCAQVCTRFVENKSACERRQKVLIKLYHRREINDT